jgi:drug/metabolite transporter (DMT)-like permease
MLLMQSAARPWIGSTLIVVATALWAGIGSSVRLVQADTWTVVFWRGAFSALALLGFAAFRFGGRLPMEFLALGRSGFGYAFASAAGTALYITAIHKTSVADVAVIYATMPFITAAIAWLWLRQGSNMLTLGASLLALAGVAMTAGGASGAGPIGGQAVAAVMTLMYASQAVLMRGCKPLSVAPVVCLASFVAAITSLPFAHAFSTPADEIAILAASGIVYGAVGDLLFAYGAQIVPSVEVALLTTLDVPLSVLFVWLAAGELPARTTVIGGVLILAAVLGRGGLARVIERRSRRKEIGRSQSQSLDEGRPGVLNRDIG